MKKTNKALKCATMVAVLGTCFHSGGCSIGNLGALGGFFGQFLTAIPAAAVSEFLIDNDAIFDLFEDGSTPANP